MYGILVIVRTAQALINWARAILFPGVVFLSVERERFDSQERAQFLEECLRGAGELFVEEHANSVPAEQALVVGDRLVELQVVETEANLMERLVEKALEASGPTHLNELFVDGLVNVCQLLLDLENHLCLLMNVNICWKMTKK